jgi:type II secretory ATPase GspE/PulE/Tfp pilus assembly ATPase PilB-like protein
MEDTEINKLKEQQNSSIMLLAHEIIGKATQKRCSDIHLEPDSNGVTLRYFLHGELLADCVLPGEIHQALVSSYKIIAGLDPNELERPQDKKIVKKVEDDQVELRITTLPSPHGELVAISMRFVES